MKQAAHCLGGTGLLLCRASVKEVALSEQQQGEPTEASETAQSGVAATPLFNAVEALTVEDSLPNITPSPGKDNWMFRL